jgi:phosphoribosylanthranilate isomerase
LQTELKSLRNGAQLKVKICGTTNIDDALLCESMGADYLGFIFYPKSKRYITPESAYTIIKELYTSTQKVGVFVNESSDVINKTAALLQLDFVQLHGDESPNFISSIKIPVIKAFRVNDDFDFGIIEQYGKLIIPLLDTYSIDLYGGTGISFNWNIIPEKLKNNIFLSGGITSANLHYIYNKINPFAVDVSSSLESSPGKKDSKKINEFFSIINRLRQESQSI